MTNITSEGRDEWKFFTCPWIKVSAERTLATAREMLTLLADSDTINSPQQASLELNKSPQRWPQGRSSRDERTWWAHLSLDHCTWGGKGQLKRQSPKTSDAALEECTTALEWTEKVRVPSPVPELYYYPVWRVTSRQLGRNGFQTTLKLEFHYLQPLESFILSNYFHSECIRDRVCLITGLIPVVADFAGCRHTSHNRVNLTIFTEFSICFKQ